ncbi:dihydroorotase [Marinobacter salexigens]|uniref:dihydroorotase n=1 Tax=Marinobacter salexigens TaxID=1925763 RepID=UPI000C289FC8|nr:dihydroorotase [Marinobacter salexigens]
MNGNDNNSGASLKITGGRLLNGHGDEVSNTALLIKNGRIAATGAKAESADADQSVDATGCVIAPGFVDLYCNLREPGNGQKGNMVSEARAAARGGFTTVCVSPETSPVNDSRAVTNLIKDSAYVSSPIRVLPVGALTRGLDGELLSDMSGLTAAGCVAVGNGSRGVSNARVLRRCLAYAQTFGLTVMLRPENQSLAADGYAHDGLVSARLGLLGIPEVAETAALMEMLLLAEETGARLHLSQISCGRSVEMIAEARRRGIAVTCDVAMHQLVYTEDALSSFDSRFHLRPPLRSEADRQALVAGVRSGVVDAIVSQHLPHESAAKQAPLPDTEPGLSSIESVLSLGLGLVQAGELSLAELVRALTTGPASVIGVNATLEQDEVADLCIFDPDAQWTPSRQSLISAGHHAPALNRSIPGVVRHTYIEGREAWVSG